MPKSNKDTSILQIVKARAKDLVWRVTAKEAALVEILKAHLDQFHPDEDTIAQIIRGATRTDKILFGETLLGEPLRFNRPSVHTVPLYTHTKKLLGWIIPTTLNDETPGYIDRWIDPIRKRREWAGAKELTLHKYLASKLDPDTKTLEVGDDDSPWINPVILEADAVNGRLGEMSIGSGSWFDPARKTITANVQQYANLLHPKLRDIAREQQDLGRSPEIPLHIVYIGSKAWGTDFVSEFKQQLNLYLREDGLSAEVFASPDIVQTIHKNGKSILSVMNAETDSRKPGFRRVED